MERKAIGAGAMNSLLRGEISAIESYEQALKKFAASEQAKTIRRLQEDHIAAAEILREHIHSRGGKPAKGSGAWGAFAKVVTRTAKLFGSAAALKALKEGEEQGIFEYENALKDFDLPAASKNLIETKLLPQTKAHIPILDELLTVGRVYEAT